MRVQLNFTETKIYDLVALVVESEIFTWSDSPSLALYQKLFLTQAALCELHFEFELEGAVSLVLTPVSAYLRSNGSLVESSQSHSVSNAEELAPNTAFFGDYQNFFGVTEAQVESMLAKFWQQYDALESRDPALQVLGLSADANWKQIQAQYRVLAAKYHPDKGGDPDRFIEIRQAFEKLRHSAR